VSQGVVWGSVVIVIVIAIVILLVIGALPGASSVKVTRPPAQAGVTLTGGCTGRGQSFSKSGQLIGVVNVPGSPKASKNHPLLVDPQGTVRYAGASPSPITRHHWHVSLFNVTVKTGGSRNVLQLTSTSGTQFVHSYLLHLNVTGLYYVQGAIKGLGGTCGGSMWVKLTGSPIGTVAWFVGLGFLVVGILMVLWAWPRSKRGRIRRHGIRGLVAGLLIGIGLSILGIVYSVLALETLVPFLVVLVAMALIGWILGHYGKARLAKV